MRATAAGDIRERLQTLGYDPETNTPEQAAARVRTEINRWRDIIRATGAKAQGA